jgi:hypothetical protein
VARAAQDTVYLEHWMRGRARLRVPKPRSPAHIRHLATRVGRSSHVKNVDANTITGSLLVSFDDNDLIDVLISDLRAMGLDIASATNRSRSLRTQSTGAVVVRQVMGRANEKLHEITDGHIDLRLLVPAIYLALAARNFTRHRARLRDASWYQLLYWAFDSFFKLHEEQIARTASRSHGRLVN